MPTRSYGQFCGLARALELVGERWALLIVRDLLVGPRRFTDLRQGLPRIPTNVLSERLKELEHNGVVRRRVLPRPATGVVYELTPYGSQLDQAVKYLGLWGAQALDQPRPGDVLTADAMVIALRSTFVPEAALGINATFELHLGEVVVHARIRDGVADFAGGALGEPPDAVIVASPAIRAVMAGEMTPAEALASGNARVSGAQWLFERFGALFRIPSSREA